MDEYGREIHRASGLRIVDLCECQPAITPMLQVEGRPDGFDSDPRILVHTHVEFR